MNEQEILDRKIPSLTPIQWVHTAIDVMYIVMSCLVIFILSICALAAWREHLGGYMGELGGFATFWFLALFVMHDYAKIMPK